MRGSVIEIPIPQASLGSVVPITADKSKETNK